MKSSQTFIQIGLFVFIGSMITLVHSFPVVYEVSDRFLFQRHTVISGLIIVPFLFGLIVNLSLCRFLVYPKFTIAAASFFFTISQFFYYQFVWDKPKDDIGIQAPVVMVIIESLFIYLGALVFTSFQSYKSNKSLEENS